jgi:uncharacterized protein YxeA
MKRFLIIIFLVLCIAISSSYIFISSNTALTKVALFNANKRTVYRCLTHENLLRAFLNKDNQSVYKDSGFSFEHNDIQFQFKQRLFDLVEVSIGYKQKLQKSYIAINEITPDSAGAEWKTELITSTNPVIRIQDYLFARKLHASMGYVLQQLQAFVVNKKNVYGLNIERTLVTDSLLITSKTISLQYPSHEHYYKMIKQLQDYVMVSGASPSNYPMLNIALIDSNHIETTVAIPVNKEIKDNGSIRFKRMFPGNILTAEVKGGVITVEEGFRQLNNYVSDYQLVPPAISFQSLVTDRLAERDSAKWITKLYYPIF